jgi:hypothetical protein
MGMDVVEEYVREETFNGNNCTRLCGGGLSFTIRLYARVRIKVRVRVRVGLELGVIGRRPTNPRENVVVAITIQSGDLHVVRAAALHTPN